MLVALPIPSGAFYLPLHQRGHIYYYIMYIKFIAGSKKIHLHTIKSYLCICLFIYEFLFSGKY